MIITKIQLVKSMNSFIKIGYNSSQKAIIIVFLVQSLWAYSQSTLLLYEPFNYTAGSTLSGQGGWVSIDELKGLRKKLSEKSDTVLVCAHRGLHITTNNANYAAENSMTAIKGAIANKLDMFECDVRASADGVLILMHDATVNRTTNGTGTISAMPYASLKQLKLKKYGTNTLTTDTIPTLEQVLKESNGKIFITLDINDKAPAADVLAMVNKTGMIDNVMFFVSQQSDAAYLLSNGAMPLPSCYNTTTFNSYIQNNIKPLVFQSDNGGYTSEWLLMKNAGCKIYDNVYLLTTKQPIIDNWAELDPDLVNGVNIVQSDYPIEMLNYLKTKNKH